MDECAIEQNDKWPTYPAYKPSGIDWLGEVPEHWEIVRIREHAALLNGFPFDSDLFGTSDGIPLVRIRDILSTDTTVIWTGDPVPSAMIGNSDILIGMDGDFNVAWWKGGPALLNQRVCCLRSFASLDQRFLYYLLPYPLTIQNDLTYATTVKHISSYEILHFHIGLPPLPEQRTIAAFLDERTAKIDALIDLGMRDVKLLTEYRTALISAAVTGKIDVRGGVA